MKSISVPSYFINAITKNVVKTGLSIEEVLRNNQIPTGILQNKNARLSASQFAELQQYVTYLLNDEMQGYMEKPFPPGTFGMACHSLIHSSTLGNALSRYCKFYQLVDRGLVPALERGNKSIAVRLTPARYDFDYNVYAYEAALYYIHRLVNWLGNAHIQPLHINLNYSKPEHAIEYQSLFFGTPVHFDQANTAIVFNRSALKAATVQNQQTLALFLQSPIYEMLVQDYESTQWSSKVLKLVNNDLTAIPELDEVAESLLLHPQTLRRRLLSEGTNFQKLKNDSRRDYAIHRLSKTKESIETIAQKTGFSEPSTFIRAFKAWTGITPQSYRKIE